MFHDDNQRTAAIRKLLVLHRMDALWSETGPTGRAYMILDEDDRSLSTGQRQLLILCFNLWKGRCRLLPTEIATVTDVEIRKALSSLLRAVEMGSAAVEDWIARPKVGL